jgi:cobalt-zinc-cadmium resistance protein CzcA
VVTANIRGRDLGSFMEEAQAKIAAGLRLPPNYWMAWGGQYEHLISAQARLLIVVPIVLLSVFGLIFATFRSVTYSLLVFTGVPFALSGGIIALWIRGISFSISAAVGFIALSGVSVLNGLVLVGFTKRLIQDGVPAASAVVDGAVSRLRPVFMTALVASLGFVPMAISEGTGSEVQRPLATVVIGGIISSMLLTLVVLPALISLVHRKGRVALTD